MKADPRGAVHHLVRAVNEGDEGMANVIATEIVDQLERTEDDAERLDWCEAMAVTIHCNYIGGPECFTVSVHDGEGGTVLPDEVFSGATWREAIDKARAGTRTDATRAEGAVS